MECRDAQFYLRLRRHAADELGADVTAPLDSHLATCSLCGAEARAAVSFDRALASAMRAVPVPSGLRERLITQAARAQGVALRNKALRAGGMVVAAILIIGIGFSLYSTTRPVVDSEKQVALAERQHKNPKTYTREWLAEQKLPEDLPWDFDYEHLWIFCGYERIEKVDVPVVVFRSRTGSGFAKVYIFRDGGPFDTKDLRDAQGSVFSGQVVIGNQKARGVRYLVVHNGAQGGLDDFLRPRGMPL
jgi:hypothetical protein